MGDAIAASGGLVIAGDQESASLGGQLEDGEGVIAELRVRHDHLTRLTENP